MPKWDEADVGGRELPVLRMTRRVAPGAELLEMGDLAYVDLGRQVPQDRLLERLAGAERAAR